MIQGEGVGAQVVSPNHGITQLYGQLITFIEKPVLAKLSAITRR